MNYGLALAVAGARPAIGGQDMKQYTPEQIWDADAGVFALGDDDLRRIRIVLAP